MSNNTIPILKAKMPYADDSMDVTEAYNYLVKTINSSFISPADIVQMAATPSTQKEFISSGSMSYAGGDQVQNYVFTHSFNVVPLEWSIIDLSSSVGATADYENATFVRTAWTTTSISIKLSYKNNLGSGSVSFKIRVKG